MRSMTRWMLAGFMALVALGVVGAPIQADPAASPFAGSWFGTWSVVDSEDHEVAFFGTFDWTISDAGRITGTDYNTTKGYGGAIVGHVGADGDLRFVREVPLDDPSRGINGFPFHGTATIDDGGKLVVTAAGTGGTRLLVASLESN